MYIGTKFERFFLRVIPDIVKTFVVPAFTLICTAPLMFIIIGPIATALSNTLGLLALALFGFSGIIAGAFMAGLWQVFVMFGLHWVVVSLGLNNLGQLGFDPILGSIIGVSFAQIGVVLAVVMKTKNKKLKSLGSSAFFTGIFGITEPAIYGVTLPLKKPFFVSCIAAAIGGAVVGLFKTNYYTNGGMGIFAIPNVISHEGIDGGFYGALLAIAISFVLGWLFTMFFWHETVKSEGE